MVLSYYFRVFRVLKDIILRTMGEGEKLNFAIFTKHEVQSFFDFQVIVAPQPAFSGLIFDINNILFSNIL